MNAELDFEPSMLPPSTRLRRRFDLPAQQASYLQFLEERIQRNPRDLRAHVERALQAIAMRERALVFAALVDLNIALGPRGSALRAALLQRAGPILAAKQIAALLAHGQDGIEATDSAASAPGVCLRRSVLGTTQLVQRRDQTSPIDFGELALAACAAGDDAAACLLLEEALQFDPGQSALTAQLLALYRHGRRRADFERARTSLLGRKIALPQLWEQTAAWFREHHD